MIIIMDTTDSVVQLKKKPRLVWRVHLFTSCVISYVMQQSVKQKMLSLS